MAQGDIYQKVIYWQVSSRSDLSYVIIFTSSVNGCFRFTCLGHSFITWCPHFKKCVILLLIPSYQLHTFYVHHQPFLAVSCFSKCTVSLNHALSNLPSDICIIIAVDPSFLQFTIQYYWMNSNCFLHACLSKVSASEDWHRKHKGRNERTRLYSFLYFWSSESERWASSLHSVRATCPSASPAGNFLWAAQRGGEQTTAWLLRRFCIL